ncbi:MAG: hypothetical protein V5A46_11505 [Haloferacaceae archaeon]
MPVPAYSTITVSEVTFDEATDPVTVDAVIPDFAREVDPGDPAFVVGIHAVDPAIGSGGATTLESLIGYKILSPGTHTDVTVPIFPTPFASPDAGQVFPPAPDGTAEIEGAIWQDFESGSPVVSGAVAMIHGGLDKAEELELLESPADAEPECPSAIAALENTNFTKPVPDPQCVAVFDPTGNCPGPDSFFCVVCCAE